MTSLHTCNHFMDKTLEDVSTLLKLDEAKDNLVGNPLMDTWEMFRMSLYVDLGKFKTTELSEKMDEILSDHYKNAAEALSESQP